MSEASRAAGGVVEEAPPAGAAAQTQIVAVGLDEGVVPSALRVVTAALCEGPTVGGGQHDGPGEGGAAKRSPSGGAPWG